MVKTMFEKYFKASRAYSYALRVSKGTVAEEQEMESIARDLDEAGKNLRDFVSPKGEAVVHKLNILLSSHVWAQGSYISAIIGRRGGEWLAKTQTDYNESKASLNKFIEELK